MMLSSFGFDKGVARTAVRNNSSKVRPIAVQRIDL